MINMLPRPSKNKKQKDGGKIYSEYLGIGKVVQDICPYEGGRIAFDGTTWPASIADREEKELIESGKLVYVFKERRGLNLLVRKVEEENLMVCREHRRVR